MKTFLQEFLSCSSRGPWINHLNSKPLKVLLPSLCVSVSVCVCLCVHLCYVCVYDGNEHWALNACVKLQKSLGLISQPFRRLNVNSTVLLACVILGEHKEKCQWLQDLCLSHNAATPMFNPDLQRETSLLNLLTLQVG